MKYIKYIWVLLLVLFVNVVCFSCDNELSDNEVNNIVDINESLNETNSDNYKNGGSDVVNSDTYVATNNKTNNDESLDKDEAFQSKLLTSSPSLECNTGIVLVDNIPVYLSSLMAQYTAFEPDLVDPEQVIDFKCGRFLFLRDGSIIDIKKQYAEDVMMSDIRQNYEPEEWDYYIAQAEEISETFLNELNKSVGIIDIRKSLYNNDSYRYYDIMTADGSAYTMRSPYATEGKKVQTPILNTDGTLTCPEFPETAEWTDVVDFRKCDTFILALRSDGQLLSSGIEFEHENIVKFDIWDLYNMDSNIGDMPVALTADGRLIFGDLISEEQMQQQIADKWYKQIEIAKSFTDVKDFSYRMDKDFVVVVRKSDGSLWITQNDGFISEEYFAVARN